MRQAGTDPDFREDDYTVEPSLRPKRLQEFIGQDRLRQNLSIFLQASLERKDALDHVLLYGPPGLGKTTLAHIIAAELATEIHVTSGPAIERPGDLVGILTNLETNSVLFIDEIHRLSRTVEEILYPAMEDQKVDIMLGKGPAARSIRLDVAPFTVVGATTRQGLLTGPLRDRFGIVLHFGLYDQVALLEIVKRSASILGFPITPDAASEIAKRSRGTPRIVNRLLRRVRDFTQVEGKTEIDLQSAAKALDSLEIDATGLDRVDRMILSCIIEKFGGGPVGLETIAAATGEDVGTIEDVYEPYLLQQSLLARTPRGRIATRGAYEHLGKTYPDKAAKQTGLFELAPDESQSGN